MLMRTLYAIHSYRWLETFVDNQIHRYRRKASAITSRFSHRGSARLRTDLDPPAIGSLDLLRKLAGESLTQCAVARAPRDTSWAAKTQSP